MTVYFTREHEWIRVDGDTATVGISDHAQQALGDIHGADLALALECTSTGDKFMHADSVKWNFVVTTNFGL